MSRSLPAETNRLTEHGDAFIDGCSDRGSTPLASTMFILSMAPAASVPCNAPFAFARDCAAWIQSSNLQVSQFAFSLPAHPFSPGPQASGGVREADTS